MKHPSVVVILHFSLLVVKSMKSCGKKQHIPFCLPVKRSEEINGTATNNPNPPHWNYSAALCHSQLAKVKSGSGQVTENIKQMLSRAKPLHFSWKYQI